MRDLQRGRGAVAKRARSVGLGMAGQGGSGLVQRPQSSKCHRLWTRPLDRVLTADRQYWRCRELTCICFDHHRDNALEGLGSGLPAVCGCSFTAHCAHCDGDVRANTYRRRL